MKAVVTGGAGFIGSALARALLDEGWSVRVFDNLLTGFEENIPSAAEFVRGDLRNAQQVRAAFDGVDLVFHLGALRSVLRSVDDPLLSADCNILGTLNVLVGASEAGVRRVVYASSSSVYGDVAEGLLHEGMTPAPISPYAVAKLAAEEYCRVWTDLHRLSTVSLRYFNVFGPGQRPESRYSNVFPAFVSALIEGRPPELHWDGEQSRDFTYVDDVVAATIAAAVAESPEINGSVINVGAGEPKTMNEVLSAVSNVVGRWIDPVRTPKRPGDVRRTHADITRARTMLGWEPRTSWSSAVEHTVEWFRERRRASGA